MMGMMDMAETGAMDDCCNDADTAAKTGKTCKTPQPCQSVGQALPFAELDFLTQDLATSVRFPRLADIAFNFDPAVTWRPPAPL